MKRTRIMAGVILLATLMVIQTGCKKNSETPENADTSTAQDNALAESYFDNATEWSDKAMAGANLKSTTIDTVYMGTCVLATLDLTASPFKLTIDFGPVNCQCDDGKWRRGKIFVTFNGNYWSPGTVINYSFENYFINDNQVVGQKTVTNMGRNTANHLWWETVVSGAVILADNGGTITWNSTRQHEWSEGESTPWVWWDDVYLITGTAGGVGANNKSYSCTITSPLRKKLNCEWLQSGTINLQVQDLPLIIVDYGTGTCDNVATVTVNGQTYTITLG